MTNYFELYSLAETLSPDPTTVRKRWQEISRIYHPDRFGAATNAEQMEAMQRTTANNAAYKTLSNKDSTLAYILKLYNVLEEEEKYSLPPDFLMEMMALNEAIDEGVSAAGSWQLAEEEWQTLYTPLANRFNEGERGQELLAALKDAYFRKKYLLRLKERMT